MPPAAAPVRAGKSEALLIKAPKVAGVVPWCAVLQANSLSEPFS
jgi:hypothetical protein